MAPKPKPSIFMPKEKRRTSSVRPPLQAGRSIFDKTQAIFVEKPSPIAQPLDYEAPPTLYEGNYNEWIDKTSMMLLALGAQGFSLNNTSPTFSEEAIRHVKRHVRPELLARLPQDCENDLNRLMVDLKKAAKPFRLMDLPGELRAMIFSLALYSKSPVVLLSTPNPDNAVSGTKRVAKPPPLTQISRIVREETMPLYFQLNVFRMYLNHLPPVGSDRRGRGNVTIQWAIAHKIWLKHLRKFVVSLKPIKVPNTDKRIPVVIEATYTHNAGLQVRWPDMRFRLKRKLQNHSDQVESYRRFLGLQGEALAMVWNKNVQVWEELRSATAKR